MIDIHNHILPNVDDGAKTIKESVSMLKTAIDHILGNITSISQSSNLNESFGRELINFSELKKQYLIIDDIEIDFD